MYLIKNIHVYAPEDIGIKDVLIDEKIIKIGNNLPAVEEYDVEVIDGTDKILVPGFIDCHVHILGGGGEGGAKTRTPEIMLSDITTAGVTTVVGCLGTDGTTRTMTNLLAKAKGLEEEGVTTYVYTGSYQVPVKTITGSITDDIILFDKIIGCGEIAISDHRSSCPTKEDFLKIVADTRLGGILSAKAGIVDIHMGDSKEVLKLLKYVLENSMIPSFNMLPTHINRNGYLMKDGIEYVKKYKGYIDLTTSGDKDHMEEGEVTASEGYKMALDEGCDKYHITYSSDGQGSLPIFDSEGRYIGLGVGKVMSMYEEFVDSINIYNIDMETALLPLTLNPAKLLKLNNKGSIEKGKDADLVIMDKDLKITEVFARGKMMIENAQIKIKGTFEGV